MEEEREEKDQVFADEVSEEVAQTETETETET